MNHTIRALAVFLIASTLWAATPHAARGETASQVDGASAELEQGRKLLRRGHAGESLIHLEKALQQFQQSGNKSGEAETQDQLGELYEQQGRYDIALQHYTSAQAIYASGADRAAHQSALVASVSSGADSYNANLMLAKMGNMYFKQSDTAQARAYYSQIRARKPEANVLKNAQGGRAKADKLKSTGSRLGSILRGTPSLSTPTSTANTVTDTLNTVRGPLDAYRQAIIYTTYELGMGRVDYFNNQLDSAKRHFESALAATQGSLPVIGNLGQTRRYRTAARTSLGDIAFKQGRFADAFKLYTEAAKGAREDERLDLMWPAQRGTGRSLWAQGLRETDAKKSAKMKEDAVNAYREALHTIETIRQGSLRADESRTTFLATTKDVFDEASAALAEMALGSTSNTSTNTSAPLEGKSLEYLSEALRVVEQGRARSLLDLLGETGANITEGVPSELLQRKQENLERQQDIAAQLTGVGGESSAPGKSLDELETDLNRLQTEYDSLENQIRAASPRYSALTAAQPLTLAEIQRQVLDDQTALVEYSLGTERSYLWAVTRTGASIYRLPARAEIERQAIVLRDQIIPAPLRRTLTDAVAVETQRGLTLTGGAGAGGSQAAAAYASIANALYKTALEPAAKLIGQNRLLIVADGALNYIPFEALVTSTAATTDYSTLAYLLKTNETIYAPSASVVAAIRQQSTASAGGQRIDRAMLVVADPVFDATDARAGGAKAGAATTGGDTTARGLTLASAVADVGKTGGSSAAPAGSPAGEVRLARLLGTRTEAEQIAKLATTMGGKADTWLDLNASEANVEARDLRPYRVLHFATHGLLNTERPQFTGLVLSLVGNRASEDGFLRTDEIFNLKLGSPLVMLSACETGLGKEKRGEGVIGLTRAFMYAGAPTVGVSLWSVADRSTADLMTNFYRRLLTKGSNSAAAMRAARQDMIMGKRYSAPFFWSPFVLVGDWR